MKTKTGRPALSLFEGPDTLAAQNRFTVETVWNNEGGPGRGLLVTVSGPAIEEDRVRAEHVLLSSACGPVQRVELVPGIVGEQRVAFADLPEWDIRAGVDVLPGAVSDAELAALGSAMIPVTVALEVIAAGPTLLHLVVSARDTDEADCLTVELDLTRPPGPGKGPVSER